MTKERIQIAVGLLTLIVGGFLYSGTLREEAPVLDAPLGGVANGKPFFDAQGTEVYTDCDLTAPKRQNIESDLKNLKAKNTDQSLRALDAKERASLKGCEIAKLKTVPKTRVQFSGADYEIEIVDTNPIDGGVEVFARAWTPQGQQIGFGVDGSVDIERFRIFNPPIFVDDPNGTVVRTDTTDKGVAVERRLREDTTEAILQSLAHTVSVKKERFTNAQIVNGKVGNTTTTVYPNAHPETSSVDGRVYKSNATYSTAHDATDGDAAQDDAILTYFANGKPGANYTIQRAFILFDTSGIADTDVVSSGTFSVYRFADQANTNGWNANLVASTPASTNALVVGDYDQVGTTKLSDTTFNNTTWTAGYKDFTLNASGISAVAVTGTSKYGLRMDSDISSSAPTGENYASFYTAEDSTGDPKLVVEHSAGATPTGLAPGANSIIFY